MTQKEFSFVISKDSHLSVLLCIPIAVGIVPSVLVPFQPPSQKKKKELPYSFLVLPKKDQSVVTIPLSSFFPSLPPHFYPLLFLLFGGPTLSREREKREATKKGKGDLLPSRAQRKISPFPFSKKQKIERKQKERRKK